jgi:hypothetical protein
MYSEPMDVFSGAGATPGFQEKAVGWQAFGDLEFIAQMTLVLVIAMVLSALIAFHPASRRKASTLEEFEQPKTFIMYAISGALIALIVRIQPSMALVVFGIGGLMRFRTNVGLAKDTGRVILTTIIGLCCGLELFVVAVLATVFGWALILVLESPALGRLVVQGIEKEGFADAASAYATQLRAAGCTILGEQKHVKKGRLALVYRAPRNISRADIEAKLATIPEAQQGALDWESA